MNFLDYETFTGMNVFICYGDVQELNNWNVCLCYYLYSLLKMVVRIAKEQKRPPNWQELERAIKRNFSGLLEGDFDPVQIIMRSVGFPFDYFQVRIEH